MIPLGERVDSGVSKILLGEIVSGVSEIPLGMRACLKSL